MARKYQGNKDKAKQQVPKPKHLIIKQAKLCYLRRKKASPEIHKKPCNVEKMKKCYLSLTKLR